MLTSLEKPCFLHNCHNQFTICKIIVIISTSAYIVIFIVYQYRVYYTYFGICGALYIIIFILAVLPNLGINCDDDVFSKLIPSIIINNKYLGYHWYVINYIDTVQSVILLITAIKVRKHVNKWKA